MENLLEGYPVVIEAPVAWGERDAFQHLNNIVYFRYFESARIAYFYRLDLIDTVTRTGIGPILASTSSYRELTRAQPQNTKRKGA